jgi:PadR family transcriptional regulator PadR
MAHTSESGVLHGTLEAIVLKTLTWGPRHGYGIVRGIEEATDGTVQVDEGTLYPALYRMERRGWIDAEWGTSELGRKAKFYRLTARGRKHLAQETAEWARLAAAVSKVLLPAT